MKRNEFWGLIINPFTKIAGWQAFGIGIIFVGLTAFLGSLRNVYFDGIIDMHFVEKASFSRAIVIELISLVSLVSVMTVAGLILTKNFRFIDILGTMTLAKTPFVILSILSLFVEFPLLSEIIHDPMSIFHSTSFIVLMLISFPIIIWSITLMFNGLKVSCGIKGTKLNVIFISALFVAEVICKVVLYLIQ